MKKLKRCPFCGSKMRLETIHDPYVDIQVIGHAENVGQICPMMRGMSWFGTAEEAAAVWNKRRRWKMWPFK